MMIPEEQLLKPRNPKINDTNAWPEFTLSQIKVLSHKSSDLVSLFCAHEGRLVRVTGKLDSVEDNSLLVDVKRRSGIIELRDVKSYSFAQFEDGSYGFWAEGRAGWFELKTAVPAYRPTFDKMLEATDMFYHMSDRWGNTKKKKKTKISTTVIEKEAQELFSEYLENRGCKRQDEDDVREGFHEYRDYFIRTMLLQQDGQSWDNAPMLQYYKLHFAREYETVEAEVFGWSNQTKPVNDKVHATTSRDAEESSQEKHDRISGYKLPIEHQVTGPHRSHDLHDGKSVFLTITPRKRKSILQPVSTGRISKKAAARHKNLPAINENHIELEDEQDDGTTSLVQESPAPTASKRKIDDQKRLAPYIAPPGTHGYEGDHKIITIEPNFDGVGPADVWTCTFLRCGYRIENASTPMAHAQAKEHFKIHEQQALERTALALREKRPYLPVNYLLKKLAIVYPGSEASFVHNSVKAEIAAARLTSKTQEGSESKIQPARRVSARLVA